MEFGNDWKKIDPNMPGQQEHVPTCTCMCTVHIKKQGECTGGNWVHGRGCGEWSFLLNNAH